MSKALSISLRPGDGIGSLVRNMVAMRHYDLTDEDYERFDIGVGLEEMTAGDIAGERLPPLTTTEVARAMSRRIDRLCEYMFWEAMRGQVQVMDPAEAPKVIKYELPVAHRPFSATPWTDRVNCHPLKDMQAYIDQFADLTKAPNAQVWLRAATAHNMLMAEVIQAERLSWSGFTQLFEPYAKFKIYDNGFIQAKAGSEEATPYIHKNEVFIIPPYEPHIRLHEEKPARAEWVNDRKFLKVSTHRFPIMVGANCLHARGA